MRYCEVHAKRIAADDANVKGLSQCHDFVLHLLNSSTNVGRFPFAFDDADSMHP